jgi:hypothetical protein
VHAGAGRGPRLLGPLSRRVGGRRSVRCGLRCGPDGSAVRAPGPAAGLAAGVSARARAPRGAPALCRASCPPHPRLAPGPWPAAPDPRRSRTSQPAHTCPAALFDPARPTTHPAPGPHPRPSPHPRPPPQDPLPPKGQGRGADIVFQGGITHARHAAPRRGAGGARGKRARGQVAAASVGGGRGRIVAAAVTLRGDPYIQRGAAQRRQCPRDVGRTKECTRRGGRG